MSKDANQKDAVIKAAYADVNKFGQNGEFDKAMKAVNRSKLCTKNKRWPGEIVGGGVESKRDVW